MENKCKIKGCENKHCARGWCSKHYQKWLRYGDAGYVKTRGTCSVDGCDMIHQAKSYCNMHYLRWLKYGDSGPVEPIQVHAGIKECTIDGCEKPHVAKGYCYMHYARWKRNGDPGPVGRIPRGGGTVDPNGYMRLYYPEHPNARSGGGVYEHTLVMSENLGRPLRKGETVHHKNGIKTDNRLENLELWIRGHVPGQRVSDLVEWAKEILDTYGTEMGRLG